MGEKLFRDEVIAQRQEQWLGTVLLARPLSHHLFTLFALLAGGAIVAFLILGTFTRKARVNGWLVPQQGLVKVFAPQAGTVSELRVREGTQVRKNDPLFSLTAERESANLGATQAAIARQIGARQDSLERQIGQQAQLATQQRSAIGKRLEVLHAEARALEREIGLQRDRVALSERSSARNRDLHRRGFLSDQQMQQKDEELLDQRSRLATLERNLLSAQREITTASAELNDIPLKSRNERAALQREMAVLEQDLAEAEARRKLLVLAPESGTVTAIMAEAGSNAPTTAPMLSIVPAGTELEAHLYGPSKAIGFVKAGHRVLLRYQAFPYQKFGHHVGYVQDVSRTAVSPAELPPQLSGLTGLYGEKDPFYRITVRLEKQAITAYGQPQALQAGMQLEADVLIETRRLYEWLLDPLYTITGKLGS